MIDSDRATIRELSWSCKFVRVYAACINAGVKWEIKIPVAEGKPEIPLGDPLNARYTVDSYVRLTDVMPREALCPRAYNKFYSIPPADSDQRYSLYSRNCRGRNGVGTILTREINCRQSRVRLSRASLTRASAISRARHYRLGKKPRRTKTRSGDVSSVLGTFVASIVR